MHITFSFKTLRNNTCQIQSVACAIIPQTFIQDITFYIHISYYHVYIQCHSTVLSSCLMIYVLLCDHDVQKPFTLIPELCKTRILCCIKVFYKSFKLKRLILFNRKRKLLKDRRFWFCCWYLYAIPIEDVF